MKDSNTTKNNPWSMNQYVNMLYVDQPLGTGFSYDTLLKSTQDLLYLSGGSSDIVAFETYEQNNLTIPAENTTFRYGTFPSQDPTHQPDNSQNAAKALYQFAQVWFTHFTEYKTEDKRVSLWGNSYGGYWVTFSAAYFQEQNVKIKAGDLKGTILPIDTIGWTNGAVDLLYQGEWYPEQAYNNTYDFQAIPEANYTLALEAWSSEGGCRDQIIACRQLAATSDPDYLSNDATVNAACFQATAFCYAQILGPYEALSNRSAFDMAALSPDPQPEPDLVGFFNREWVQRALGVPLNFTANSYVTQTSVLFSSGDAARADGVKKMEYLLDQGVKIALVYGDRDYRCPWNGAEKMSLAVNWTEADAFRSAGYANIEIGACHQSHGVVRQHGNMSFSRVFQAGHDAAYYQPETVFEIFTRAVMGKDVATGRKIVDDGYSSKGPSSSWHIREVLPPSPKFECNLYGVATTCTIEQYEALMNGTAVLEEFRVVKPVGVTPGQLGGM